MCMNLGHVPGGDEGTSNLANVELVWKGQGWQPRRESYVSESKYTFIRTAQQHTGKGSSRDHHCSTTDSSSCYLEVHPLDIQCTHSHQPIILACKQHGRE